MRLLFADDHDLVRDAVSALMMRDDASVTVIQADNLDSALETVRTRGPFDAAILDLNMPGMNGADGVRRMQQVAPGLPVIILSGSGRAQDVAMVLDAGARGFLPKTMAGKVLLNAVRLVVAGEAYVPADLLGQVHALRAGQTGCALTPREMQVLGQLRHGASNKQIARALDIQETTVKLHLRAISDKLSARNRTDIVLRAIESGIA